MKINLFSKLLFAALLAFTVNSFIYFSFGNIYSSKILNYHDFTAQFESGIYQYRFLSGELLIFIYESLSHLSIDYQHFKFKFFDADSEPKMYLSFYILNTFFMVLSAIAMVIISETKNFIATNAEKLLIIAVSVLTIGLSQFVIVPYDISSYFFLLLFFYFLLKYLEKTSSFHLLILVLIICVSTLNRESSALSLSLAATLLYSKFGFKKEMILSMVILIIAFVTTYFGLRYFAESFTTNDGSLLSENFSQPKNLLGFLFWLLLFLFSLMIANDKKAVNHILIFHLLSLPYILMCFYTGIIYEIRLYIPLFLASLFLARTRLGENSII